MDGTTVLSQGLFAGGFFLFKKVEKEHIRRVLKLAEGNKSKAARLLGISRKKLYQKCGGDG